MSKDIIEKGKVPELALNVARPLVLPHEEVKKLRAGDREKSGAGRRRGRTERLSRSCLGDRPERDRPRLRRRRTGG